MAKSKSLKAQFLKELKASPKKAAALGLLLLVGLYFWVPLAKKSLSGKSKPLPPTPVGAAAAGTPLAGAGTSAATTPAGAAPSASLDWQTRARWLDENVVPSGGPGWAGLNTDRLPLAFGPLTWVAIPGRDPFREVRLASATLPADETAAEPTVTTPKLTAQSLGLHLTSTVVGPRQRSALINGRVYREGSEVPCEAGLTLVLAQIGPRRALLEYQDQAIELTIERSALASPVVTGSGNALGRSGQFDDLSESDEDE